jgi:hypothetical protein
MATFTKTILSASTDGRGVKVAATASAGTTIHTGSSTPTDFDEIWAYVQNTTTTSVLLTIEFGGTTSPDDRISTQVIPASGLVLVVPGLILKGNATPLIMRAFAGTTNVLVMHGWVNRIS